MSDDSKFVVPSALNTDSWQLWLTSILYLSTSLLALIDCSRSFFLSKGIHTYRFNFLFYSFMFSLLRGMMTLLAFPDWKNHMSWLYFLNLFLPNYLQYYIFSLLALFVVQVFMTFNNQEEYVETWLYRSYHAIQLILLAATIVASYYLGKLFEEQPDSSIRASQWDQVGSVYNVVLYGVLTIVGGYFSYRCYLIISTMLLSDRQRTQQKRYMALTILFCVIFCCRFLWCTLYFAEKNPVMTVIETWILADNQTDFDSAFLVFYFFFEILPTFIVVISFRPPLILTSEPQQIRQIKNYNSSRPVTPRLSPRLSPPRVTSPFHPSRINSQALLQDEEVENLVLTDYI